MDYITIRSSHSFEWFVFDRAESVPRPLRVTSAGLQARALNLTFGTYGLHAEQRVIVFCLGSDSGQDVRL